MAYEHILDNFVPLAFWQQLGEDLHMGVYTCSMFGPKVYIIYMHLHLFLIHNYHNYMEATEIPIAIN